MSLADPSIERFATSLRERAIGEARGGRLQLADGEDALREQVEAMVEREAAGLSTQLRRDLVERVVRASVGFGRLDDLFDDPGVDEIMVNGHRSIWVERHGAIESAGFELESVEELENLIERMVAPLGRRVDEASPICDARLPDGSRVNVVIPPLSLAGPILTIRRFRHAQLDPQALVANGTVSDKTRDLLERAVRGRLALLVSGGTGSGKTTTLNAISEFIPANERIVTIEDSAELRLRQGHVVRLEARPPNLEEKGEITIRALVKTALRMRPDRIVVGEVRGGEALDMLSAMTTGHDGSLTTVHASSSSGALERIQTLAMMSGVEVPHIAVRRMVAAAIDLVVHQTKTKSGDRIVAEIAQVVDERDGYRLNPLMRRDVDGEERWSQPVGELAAAISADVGAIG